MAEWRLLTVNQLHNPEPPTWGGRATMPPAPLTQMIIRLTCDDGLVFVLVIFGMWKIFDIVDAAIKIAAKMVEEIGRDRK